MSASIIIAILFLSICAIIILIDFIALFKQYSKVNKTRVFNFIDRLIVVISLIIIPITLLWDINYLQYRTPIEYSKWETITLNDFRGFNRPYQTLDGETKFAFVRTSIYVSKNEDRIEIKTLFHPCRSYVYNKNLFSENLLTHELYHFHITEYCARLMRKEVMSLSQSNPIKNLAEIKSNTLKYERILQYQYDDDTYHGYVVSKQIEWQKKIDSSLHSLKDYSQTIISLKK